MLGWTAVPLAILMLWQIGAARLEKPWLLPTVTAVAARLAAPLSDVYASGSLAGNTLVSIVRVVIGFAIAAVVGVSLGLSLGAMKMLRGLMEPTIEILRPLCPIAWLPFAIAVFKLETIPQLFGLRYTRTILDQVQVGMVFVLFWGALFPILLNTVDGVLRVNRNYALLGRMLGAGRLQCFRSVYLPAAMPSILTGLRHGIGTCWFVIIAAEMLPGSQSGIGYLLMYAADQSAMDVVVASMFIIGVVGALFNFSMVFAMRTFVHWQGKGG